MPAAAIPTFTRQSEHLLRAGGQLDWAVVTLLALVVYVYSVEVERRNWSAILAGLGLPNRWAIAIGPSCRSWSSCSSMPTASFTGSTGGGTWRRSP